MRFNILVISLILLFIPILSFSQTDVLSRLHGLSQNGNQFYEVGGTMVTVVKEKRKLNDKDIKKIKKKHELKNVVAEYSDPHLNGGDNLIIENIEPNAEYPEFSAYGLYYLLPLNDKEIELISFQTVNKLDSTIQKEFLDLSFRNKVAKLAPYNWGADQIDFVGRTIELGSACRWMYPHNVQCSGLGQMNWAIFTNKEDAEAHNQIFRKTKNAYVKVKTLKEEDINIVFEGTPTVAKRIVMQPNKSVAHFVTGSSTGILAVYYVVQEVRGAYVSCILSQYVNNTEDYKLAPLLTEVMSLTDK